VTNIESRIRDFIREEILFRRRSVVLTADTQLGNGLMDSLGMARLISFLEQEFDIEIEHADLVPANFSTVRDIEALISRKVEAA
jgi:acyl carrier protein